jgi:DNA-binding IclR family transcriptional regulator
MSGGAREPGRSVANKLITLVGAFAVGHEELTLTEISHRSDLPIVTARRLLGELVDQRLVERTPSGRYRIGLRLWEIGSHAVRRNALRQAAIPPMRDMYNSTYENIQLAVPDAGQVLYVERITGARSAPSRAVVGSRWPLHATCAGKVLLAHMDREAAHAALTGELARLTPHTVVRPGLIARNLADIRDRGVAVSYGEDETGLISVAAPIFEPGGQDAVAAIAIIGHWHPRGVRRLAPAVRAAARTASAELRVAMETNA